MKKVVTLFVAIGLIIALIVNCAFFSTPDEIEIYFNNCVVVEVDDSADTVECVDTCGEVWAFYGTDEWQVGDSVVLTMDTCKTQSIYDDTIISVKGL